MLRFMFYLSGSAVASFSVSFLLARPFRGVSSRHFYGTGRPTQTWASDVTGSGPRPAALADSVGQGWLLAIISVFLESEW